MSTTATIAQVSPWRAALRGARANLAPGLVLQAFALALVLAYYWHDGARMWFDKVAGLRESIGVVFPMVTTAVFGAIIPWLYLRALPATRGEQTGSRLGAMILFWAAKGCEVDLLYCGLARFFGTGTDFTTIATKAFLDQFIYCPIWAVPSCWAMYAFAEADLRLSPVVNDIRTPGWYARSVLPVLVSNLGIWLPAVALIYSLPTGLQLPMQNLVLCFYTLLIATLTRKRA